MRLMMIVCNVEDCYEFFKEGDDVCDSGCGEDHYFHPKCLNDWRNKTGFTCPTCDELRYGGVRYIRGKDSTKGLFCKAYEQWGFLEDASYNTYYKCFDISPLPSMVLDLNDPTRSIPNLYKALIDGEEIYPKTPYCEHHYPNWHRRKPKVRKKTRRGKYYGGRRKTRRRRRKRRRTRKRRN